MRKLLTLTAVVLACVVGGTGTNSAQAAKKQRCVEIHQGINFYRSATHKWQRKLGIPITRSSKQPIRGCAYAKWVAELWRNRALKFRNSFAAVLERQKNLERYYLSLYGKWECIHKREGAWNSNTGNGYYGGLQMDMDFQRAHGWAFLERWGTANNWPVWAQIAAAEDAFKTRGFHPWPNTARACGLL